MSQADGGKSAGANGSQPLISEGSHGKDGSKPSKIGYDENKKQSQIIVNRNKGFGIGQGKSNLTWLNQKKNKEEIQMQPEIESKYSFV